MPTPAEQLRDELIKHRVGLGRFSTQLVYKAIALLNRVERDIVARLQQMGDESLNRSRLEQILVEVRLIEAQGWDAIGNRFVRDLESVADAELGFATKSVEFGAEAVGLKVGLSAFGPSIPTVMAAVNARPFDGRFLSEWLSGLEDADARRVREAIRIGFVEGEPINKIVQRIRGTKAAQFKDGVMDISRRSAEAMVRTAVTHTSSMAQQLVYNANADIIDAVRWVSVLDNRTTIICAGLDGKVFPLDSGPRPPQHINCRSTIVPEIKGMDMAAIAGRPTFDSWLRSQPDAVQRDILGETRLRLWKEGGLKLDRFIDSKNRILTLDQLKARDAEAFEKANIAA